MKLRSGLFLFAFVVLAAGPMRASAASFFTLPSGGQFKVGQSFDLEIRIDSEGQAFNAAQATVQFPKAILEAKSVSTSGSVFNFWLEEASFSNDSGTASFIGGTTSGILSSSAKILTISFTVKATGSGQITFNNTAITASDGTGSNILSSAKGASIIAGSVILEPAPAPSVPGTTPPSTVPPEEAPKPAPAPVVKPPIPPPTQIIRTPVAAKKLPVLPVITLDLYGDQGRWYNLTLDFLAQWDLPNDISDVATAINNNPNFAVPQQSEGLFNAKTFEALTDGIWYLHVRFKNNVGWGPTAHYKISIDTAPPALFGIENLEKEVTDNPTPTFVFNTGDSLSGLKDFTVRLDDGDAVAVSNGTFKTSPQPPGKHTIYVRATDNAGNARDVNSQFEILPISGPVITFINDLFVGEGGLEFSGTALSNAKLNIELRGIEGNFITSAEAAADASGSWESSIDYSLKKGIYFLTVVAEDSRGAKSLSVQSRPIRVKERPLTTIAGLEVTKTGILTALLFLLVFGAGAVFSLVRRGHLKRQKRVVIAKRDVFNVFEIIGKDLDSASTRLSDSKITKDEVKEIKFIFERIKVNIDKMKRYVIENIEEIND